MKNPNVRAFFDTPTATWTYVVWSESDPQKRCAVIDSVLNFDIYSCTTKTSACDSIIDFIKKHKLTVEWILETHIHADHITGAAYLKEKLGGKTAISKHILHVLQTWQPYFNNVADTPLDGSQFDHLFEDDEQFTIGDLEAKIIHTPGHTPADTTYIVGDAVFVGDAMFLPDVGSGRCDFPGGSAVDSYTSSRKLFSLPEASRMYVAHDYPPAVRGAECMATILSQKVSNVRLKLGISQEEFVAKRTQDDTGKPVPQLLLPSIQVNLRAGNFGNSDNGVQYIKLPLNKL
ncbi:MBL fold metallo-hydrolase [Desulfovibrio litoralis]|uniref:Glyoxylase, beta-lactamase superfamily II n=1 Tax=Desulfovibrio litoralis DSM 11393 TaxID=1121455 RepID=A0A1M7THN0_9BACT|nr:MBL fold metallo-hydrolase [Desulfovibrio litoralis]SHN70264.1 Glyoxylase, beta-lactamase superfamily II [Desulfovibrio litoralis DSM 11393]